MARSPASPLGTPSRPGASGQAGIKATLCPQERKGAGGGKRWLCWPHKAPFSPGPGRPQQAGPALRQSHPPRAWEPLLLAGDGWLAGLAAAPRAEWGPPEALSPVTVLGASAPGPRGKQPGPFPGEHGAPLAAQPRSPARPLGSPEDTGPAMFTLFISPGGGI